MKFSRAVLASLVVVATLTYGLGAVLEAQSATLEYQFVGKALAEVQTYTQQITVNATVLTGTPTCVATSATLTTCTMPIGTLPTGTNNTIRIAATKGGATAETVINGVDLSSIPANANNPKVKITVTIALGGS